MDAAPAPPPLLPRIAAGDPAAVPACIARYGGLVWGLARRYLGNAADAEDATQEIFVELWRAAGRFDPGQAGEATFVALVARRRLIDMRRRIGRRPPPGPLDSDVPTRPADPRAAVDTADDAARAAAALNQLAPNQRAAVRLAVCDGLTHEQVAARLGLPLGTVKTHIRRGLMRVRDLLAVRGLGPGGAA